MEYLCSPKIIKSEYKFLGDFKKMKNKKNYSSNKINNFKDKKPYKKVSPHCKNINTNYLNIVNNDINSVNDSQKENDESSDDLIIPNFRTNENNSTKIKKKMIIRTKDNKIKYKINNLTEYKTKNKNSSHSLKKLLESQKTQKKKNDILAINNSVKNENSKYYINIIKENYDKNQELMNINKSLFNNLNERNIKINNLINENKVLKSKLINYSLEEKTSINDNIDNEKYSQLEKEIQILKNSIIDYQKQNKELINEINELRNKNENNKEKKKNNLLPIKVNIKENNRNNYSGKSNCIDLIIKENNKLIKENKIYKIQIEEYVKKVKDLLFIIESKDNYIKILKNNIINDKDNINKIEQYSNINNTEIKRNNFLTLFKKNNNINKSVDKLIIENEENKKKINQIFEKINNLGKIEKEYRQYININVKEIEPKLLIQNESPFKYRNIYFAKNNHNNYQIERNKVKNQDNNIKINIGKKFSIEKNEIQINENIPKDELKFDYQIQKNEIKIINKISNNNETNKKNDDKKYEKQLEISNINEIKYISNKNINLGIYKVIKESNINYNNNNIIGFRNNRFLNINEKHKNNDNKDKLSPLIKEEFKKAKEEIKEKEEDKCKRNPSNKNKEKKKIKILEGIDITEINTFGPVRMESSLSFLSKNDINKKYLYLYGLYKDNICLKFDLINKKWLKQIKILDIEDLSETFKDNYIYEKSIIYNVLNGFLILTGKNTNILYYYNAINETIFNVCTFNGEYNDGKILLDKESNRLFVFDANNNKISEYYSFNEKKIYEIPKLNIKRENSSFIIHNNQIYCFFGYSNQNKKYINSIEFIDLKKLDKWNLIIVNDFDNFLVEKMAVLSFKEEPKYIYLYCGIKNKEDSDKIAEDNIIKYDIKENKIELINEFEFTQYKFIGYKWRKCDVVNNKKERTFIFEKINDFIELPYIDNNLIENNEINRHVPNLELNNTKVLMDAENNIHYIFYNSKNVEIFRAYYK